MLLRLALARLPMQSVLRIPTTIASPISGMEWRICQTFEHVHCTVQICIKRRRWRNWWSWRRTIKLMTAGAWCMVTTQLYAPERKNTKLSQYHCLTSQNHSSTSWHYTGPYTVLEFSHSLSLTLFHCSLWYLERIIRDWAASRPHGMASFIVVSSFVCWHLYKWNRNEVNGTGFWTVVVTEQ